MGEVESGHLRLLLAMYKTPGETPRKEGAMPVWAEAAFYLGVLAFLAGIYSKLSQAVDRLNK
jgi:hypothetical protein